MKAAFCSRSYLAQISGCNYCYNTPSNPPHPTTPPPSVPPIPPTTPAPTLQCAWCMVCWCLSCACAPQSEDQPYSPESLKYELLVWPCCVATQDTASDGCRKSSGHFSTVFFLPIFSCWPEVRENTGENNRFCFNQVCIIGPRLDPAECGAANTINNSAAPQLQSQVSWEQHNTQKTHRWHCSSLQLTPPCKY